MWAAWTANAPRPLTVYVSITCQTHALDPGSFASGNMDCRYRPTGGRDCATSPCPRRPTAVASEWDLEWDTRALAQKDPRVVHRKTTTVQRERVQCSEGITRGSILQSRLSA